MASILVVDDDAVVRRLCTAVLQDAGHTVLTAGTVPEARRKLEVENVDLVLSDVSMPEMSGMELLKNIHETKADMPVVMMTGFATVDVAVQALKSGATDFLRKPFENIELARVVARCLESLAQSKALKAAQEELQSTVQELRRSNSAKANLIAMIAHDVRAPLIGMRTVLELMLHRRTQRKELEITISELHGTACTLASLLDNLLDLSRFENGRLELYNQRVQLRDLIEQCLPGWRHVSPGRPINVSGQFPEVYADRDRVIQILMNLVSNAIKFSAAGTPIEIIGEPEGEWLHVSVRDHGMGIPPHEIPRLFDHFYRPASEQIRRIPGAGLGLSIVRSLVTLHGGRVWAESTPGQGSTFSFTLPLAGVGDRRSEAPQAEEEPVRG